MIMDFAPNSMQNARKILNIVDNYRDKKGHVEITKDEVVETQENIK